MKNLIYRPAAFNNAPSVFDSFFNNMINSDGFFANDARHSSPLVNIKETENGYHIELAAPGLAKEDFKISFENNLLTISAKKENKVEETTEKYTRREFGFSSFSRSFTLPKTIDADQIKATYENGVLKVELVHLPEAKKEAKAIAIS